MRRKNLARKERTLFVGSAIGVRPLQTPDSLLREGNRRAGRLPSPYRKKKKKKKESAAQFHDASFQGNLWAIPNQGKPPPTGPSLPAGRGKEVFSRSFEKREPKRDCLARRAKGGLRKCELITPPKEEEEKGGQLAYLTGNKGRLFPLSEGGGEIGFSLPCAARRTSKKLLLSLEEEGKNIILFLIYHQFPGTFLEKEGESGMVIPRKEGEREVWLVIPRTLLGRR